MKYLIAGSGGTGGATGAFLHLAGKDVTFLARGNHLQALQEQGLKLRSGLKGEPRPFPVKAADSAALSKSGQKFDVVFVCTKSYSLDSVAPLIGAVSHPKTVVIPLLNVYGTGESLQVQLPEITVLDGCIYIVAYLDGPGTVVQAGKIFRIVYGEREAGAENAGVLAQVAEDLTAAGIQVNWSQQIKWDTYKKYSFICAYATAGAYFDVPAGAMQRPGPERELVAALFAEMQDLAVAMGLNPDVDLVQENLAIVDAMGPEDTASMQKDLAAGRQSEMDGLTFAVVRLGQKHGVPVPNYEKIAAHFGYVGALTP